MLLILGRRWLIRWIQMPTSSDLATLRQRPWTLRWDKYFSPCRRCQLQILLSSNQPRHICKPIRLPRCLETRRRLSSWCPRRSHLPRSCTRILPCNSSQWLPTCPPARSFTVHLPWHRDTLEATREVIVVRDCYIFTMCFFCNCLFDVIVNIGPLVSSWLNIDAATVSARGNSEVATPQATNLMAGPPLISQNGLPQMFITPQQMMNFSSYNVCIPLSLGLFVGRSTFSNFFGTFFFFSNCVSWRPSSSSMSPTIPCCVSDPSTLWQSVDFLFKCIT